MARPPALLAAALVLLLIGAVPARAWTDSADDPLQQHRLDLESGILWHFAGSSSPQDYVFMPQVLSLVGPTQFHRRVLGHDLVLRSRFSLLVEPILQAHEHHYDAGSASGLLEWWDDARTYCLFLTSGGGFGWLDAKGYSIPGGQGQEFNLNWLVYGGGRLRLSSRLNASLGLYFQHVSNGHLNKLDPGINMIGPMLSLAWRF